MNILVTGAKGFVGRNLVETLRTIQDGRNRIRSIQIDNIYEYDKDSDPAELEEFVSKADFIFHLAGVNRPEHIEDFRTGNFGFTSQLLDIKIRKGNTCPIMLSSSVQATLLGRFAGSEYGLSKRDGEDLLFSYGEKHHVKVLVYRFPNLFGKWCRPNYNSAVATFCHNIANDLPIQVNDPTTELDLVYIDDLVEEMLDALEGKEHHCSYDGVHPVSDPDGKYCYVPTSHHVMLGEIAELLHVFDESSRTLIMPKLEPNSFEKKSFQPIFPTCQKRRPPTRFQ